MTSHIARLLRAAIKARKQTLVSPLDHINLLWEVWEQPKQEQRRGDGSCSEATADCRQGLKA